MVSGAWGRRYGVTLLGPHPPAWTCPCSEPDGPGCPRMPRQGPERNEASWAPSQCLSVPVYPPTHTSRPWHSNQCPLTSHLAISVNQLKLARCHKNIYTFYAIGKFKSSSCALLPRKLHSTLDWTAQAGGPGHRGKAGLGQLEQLSWGL